MIQTVIDEQNEECMGGFIATYADAIMLHINPSNLYKQEIAIIIKGNGTNWAKNVSVPNANQIQDKWLEIAKDTIKPQRSPIFRKICFFKVMEGNLYGTYIISEDFIKNERFSGEESYLNFITN